MPLGVLVLPIPLASSAPVFAQEAASTGIPTGSGTASDRLGSGERMAILADLREILGADRVTAVDAARLAEGQIPLARNLAHEQTQLPRARATFRSLYGHDPVFSRAHENLAWNTLMYRIRFPRDLTLEREGIQRFQRIFQRQPRDPFQWSTVRVLGYLR